VAASGGGSLSNLGLHSLLTLAPQPIKSPLRNPCVADGHFNRTMAQPFLNGSKIDALVSKSVAAAMPQTVRMKVVEACSFGGSLYKVIDSKPCQSALSF
jgi:hypothetical protein